MLTDRMNLQIRLFAVQFDQNRLKAPVRSGQAARTDHPSRCSVAGWFGGNVKAISPVFVAKPRACVLCSSSPAGQMFSHSRGSPASSERATICRAGRSAGSRLDGNTKPTAHSAGARRISVASGKRTQRLPEAVTPPEMLDRPDHW